VLDRESSFADATVVELLQRRFVPVALDVWYEERRQDPAGEFYRKVVFQREGMVPDRTTQGFYIFGPDGALISGWNNRDTGKVRDRLRKAADDYAPAKDAKSARGNAKQHDDAKKRDAANASSADPQFVREPPDGGLVVDVHSRIVKASWPDDGDEWQKILRGASGLDHLWITKDEVEELARGRFPTSLATRIARFHCIDNTRGEPPTWEKAEVKALQMETKAARTAGASGLEIEGQVQLATESGDRRFDARAFGVLERKGDRITRFDLAIRGQFSGEGTFTKGAPPGEFTLAIVFTLADPSEVERARTTVPPQGARWLDDYFGRV
jgi:hypothetical protein